MGKVLAITAAFRFLLRGVLLGAVLLTTTAWAEFGAYASHRWDGQSLVVSTDRGQLRLTALHEAALEVHYREDGVEQLPSFAIAGDPETVEASLNETPESLEIKLAGLTAVIGKSPVKIAYLRGDEALVAEEHGYFAYDTVRGFRFQLDDAEKILGGGQRVLGMDRRGQRMPLYNRAHYGYTTRSDQMYYSVPAIMSSDKYIIVFDNSARGWLDIDKSEEDILQFDAVAGRTAYLIIAADSYPSLLDNYTRVTGRQPLPPRWAFGNFASRFGYRSEKETREVVRRFRRQDIPLDAVILDLYWFGPEIQGHMGNLDWDRDAFPSPEKMIADFADQGVKTITITEPFVLTSSRNWADAVDSRVLARNAAGAPKRFEFFFGPTGLIDVFDGKAQDWFWRFYERLFEQGVAGTWGDLGEPEVHPGDALHWLSDGGIEATGDAIHNAYGHVWARLVYQNQVRRYPDNRPLIIMRSGFAGTQRYGIVPWTGDVSRSWDGLKPQIELSLQMSLFGLAYTHSDLGGFAGGEEFDRELYLRWLQYGVFQPIYRPHAHEKIPPEPVFHDRKTRSIARRYIKLRYRLLPYVYTLAYENSSTGMPLMRPLFFEDESDPALIDEKNAYIWGNAFLVAPVMSPGRDAVEVNLPPGAWFDFWTDTRYSGARAVKVPVTLETIPVLVRAGSFVPMTGDISTTRDYSSRELTLHYYADSSVPDADGQMYEDDGESRSSLADGRYELLHFAARQGDGALTIGLRRAGGVYAGMPEVRELTIVLHHWTAAVADVRFGGRQVPLCRSLPRSGFGAVHNPEAGILTVRVSWDHSPAELRIN